MTVDPTVDGGSPSERDTLDTEQNQNGALYVDSYLSDEYFRDRDPDRFIHRARAAVILSLKEKPIVDVTPNDLYVVWFCKTLQNWKALISTDKVQGVYWEVTYNGDKQEAYVDLYTKVKNTVVSV